APRFDRPREMRSPEAHRGKRCKELVVLPIVQFHEAMKATNGGRGPSPSGLEVLPKESQRRALEIFTLDAREDMRQHVEIASRPFRRMQRLLDGSPLGDREEHLGGKNPKKRR